MQKIIDKGFAVKLPAKLFREIALPAAVEQSVTLKGRTVSLDARPLGLRVSESMLWYGVALGAERRRPLPRLRPVPAAVAHVLPRPFTLTLSARAAGSLALGALCARGCSPAALVRDHGRGGRRPHVARARATLEQAAPCCWRGSGERAAAVFAASEVAPWLSGRT